MPAAAGNGKSPREQVRTAEVIAALCRATDLGMGFPFEHGLSATLTTMRLCDVMGVDTETASVTYYVSLLMYAGCTVDAEERWRWLWDVPLPPAGQWPQLVAAAPDLVAVAALRLLGLASGGWLLASSLLYVCAAAATSPTAMPTCQRTGRGRKPHPR